MKYIKHSNMAFFCKQCGKDITHKDSNRRSFCDSNCFNEWQRKIRKGFKSEKRLCLECKKEFECKPFEKKKFCCHSCSAIYTNRDRKNNHPEVFVKMSQSCKIAYAKGKINGLTKGHDLARKRNLGVVTKICPICKKEYQIPKWKENYGGGKYCSKECCYKRPGQGGYHPGSVTNFKSGWYISSVAGQVWLDSSYEFVVAEYLDEKKYKWIKNTKGFPYKKIENNIEKDANYIPDFYIEDLDLWVETKGYFVENDQRKLDAFPYKIKLITKKIIYDKKSWGF